jgi:hypothetical protein
MGQLLNELGSINWVTVLIAGILVLSIMQGMRLGASSSARRLMLLLAEGVATVLGLIASWKLATWLSPQIQAWLIGLHIEIPTMELNFFQQLYYTIITAVRDFALLRFGILFLLGYGLIKQILYRIIEPLLKGGISEPARYRVEGAHGKGSSIISSLLGGIIGTITGAGRALMVIAGLFVFTTLLPQTSLTSYIQASTWYQKGATEVIQPVTGNFIANQLPVFTRAVEQEFTNILQRKYEVLDAQIPPNIADAAKEVAAKGKTEEEKAQLLYKWIGTRVNYDYDKVDLYEQKRIWKEQTPEETFATKKGVCIDYSRLYAVMARSVGLEVKVVTGLGYDGRGGYGPHAWNEVYLNDKKQWIPLDSTWVASGGNWFNPPNFEQTHIREA